MTYTNYLDWELAMMAASILISLSAVLHLIVAVQIHKYLAFGFR